MRRVCWASLALLACIPARAPADGKSGIEPTAITLPKGASSIQGLGESFAPDLHTGASSFRVPVTVPPGVNGLVPSIALQYSSGGGNTEVGLGWSLGLPVIQRRTDKGLPRYADGDLLILRGLGGSEELVPVGNGRYRQRTEGSFVRVDRGPDGFEARSRAGIIYRFGWGQPDARIDSEGRTFAWFLTDVYDSIGNHVAYHYQRDGVRPYLAEIIYNDFSPAVQNRIAFEYEPRPDAHVDYRATFAVVTGQRLKRIVVGHGGQPVRSYELGYLPGSTLSRLATVVQVGRDGQTKLPPLTLAYHEFDPQAQQQVAMATPPGRALGPSAELADLNGDSFPDLLVTQPGSFTYYPNDGGDRFDPPQAMAQSPSLDLAYTGTQLADVDGDGLADLVAKMGPVAGELKYFPGTYNAQFAASISFAENPSFSFEDPQVRLLDLDGDKRVDVFMTSTTGLYAFFNQGTGHWQGPVALPAIDPTEQIQFSSSQIKLADMNGDGLLDVVHVRSGAVVYWPAMGFGHFDTPVIMTAAPPVDQEQHLEVRDLDGDGLADLVLLGVNRVDYWLQRGDGAFADGQAITGTPYNDFQNTQVRFADMNGNGTTDILWVNVTGSPAEAWVYLDVIGDRFPGLLRQIDNGLGKVITIQYSSSGSMYAAAKRAGKPWARGLPHAVAVVSQIVVSDSLGWQSETDITYADGVYEGVEREFRGFAHAERHEVGDESAPGLVTAEHYDLGLTEYALKGKELDVDLRGEGGEVYRRTTTTWQTRLLATGTDGTLVVLPYASAQEIEHIEAGSAPARAVRDEHEYDDFGNQTVHRQLGDVALDGDEVVTTTEYVLNTEDWIVDRKQHEVVTDLAGQKFAERFFYYDGPEFEGLPLGQVARGELVRVEEWRGDASGGGFRQRERNKIDQWGNITAKLDPSGNRRDLEFDAEAHTFVTREVVHLDGYTLEASADYDRGLGAVTSYTDWNGNGTTYAYDSLGRLAAEVKPGDTTGLPTTAYEYQLGSPLSAVWTRSRIDSGKPATFDCVSYSDGLGRKRQTRTAAEDGKWVVSEAVGFNPRGGVRQQVHPFFGQSADYAEAAPSELRDLVGYDAQGRTIVTIEPDGSKTSVVFKPLADERYDEEDNDPTSAHYNTPHLSVRDGLGRTVEHRERNQGAEYVTRYQWNPLGKLATITDANGATRSFTHDALGRRTDIFDANIGQWHYVFDDADNLLEHHDSKGRVVRLSYDAVNRPLLEEHIGPDGSAVPAVAWRYDQSPAGHGLENVKGRLAWTETPAATDFRSHDARGRLVMSESVMRGHSYVTRLQYNALGHDVSRTYPDGAELRTRYNARQLVEGVGGIVAKIEYDASGKQTKRTYGNGVESALAYDERERLQSINSARGGTTLQVLTLTLDRTTNVTAVTDGLGKATQSFTYDDLYRLTGATGAYGTLGFTYGPTGNLLRRDASDTPRLALGDYWHEGAGPHQVTSAGGDSYQYDENGNLVGGRGRTFEYDADQRLVRATLASGTTIEMAYDEDGDRRLKRVTTTDGGLRETLYIDAYSEVRDGALVKYVWLGGHRIAEIGPGAKFESSKLAGALRWSWPFALLATLLLAFCRVRMRRLRLGFAASLIAWLGLLPSCGGNDHLLDKFPKDGRLYLADFLGSTNVVADAAGSIVYEELTHPYGTGWQRSGSVATPYRYTGKEYDEELGVYYFGKRYYDPLIARWLTPDVLFLEDEAKAVGDPQQSNLYAYAANNPVSLLDPRGADVKSWAKLWGQNFATGAVARVTSPYHYVKAAVKDPLGVIRQNFVEAARHPLDALEKAQAQVNPGAGGMRELREAAWAIVTSPRGERINTAIRLHARRTGDLAVDGVLAAAGGAAARLRVPKGLCFAGGTLVLTERGLVPIELVRAGELVWSRDDQTGGEAFQEVTATYVTPDQPMVALELVDESGRPEVLEVTPEHPFAVPGYGWVAAEDLRPGNPLSSATGQPLAVKKRTWAGERVTVYNLQVAAFHTYFVGETSTEVHNTCAAGAGGRPSLSALKEALKKVHKELGGSLPPGQPGKFGSPQRGTPRKGYRLDPEHPGRPKGHPEAGPHINWWDYTGGKRGSGGRAGAIPIE